MGIKILSWNVNSIRARLEHLASISKRLVPDIICLQETKVTNDQFPKKMINDIGYNFIYLNGIKAYNGVCILSKIEAKETNSINWCNQSDGRHIQANINGLNIHSIYIPAGGEIPDLEKNKKYKHKIDFLDELTSWSKKKKNRSSVICGDLNIAPLEDDVWCHKQLKNVVSHTLLERNKLIEFQKSGNWCDIIRKMLKPEENLFTWWSYRSPNFKQNNRGRRLDHAWVSDDLNDGIKKVSIFKEAREWERPSDHVPIIIEMKD